MKKNQLCILLLFLLINLTLEEVKHKIVLSSEGSLIENEYLSETAIDGVTEADNVVKISEPGTFTLKGDYQGQVLVELEDKTGEVTLILDGVNIINHDGPAILITKANEIDGTTYSRQSTMTYEKAKNLDFTHAGIKIIIADDSKNYVKGGYTDKYDGAFFSKVSMVISGGEKGNGELTVIGENEGLDSKMHMQINGGNINVLGNDDAINVSEDYGSVIIFNGGKTIVNGGQVTEGDGVDSNGMIIVNGGTVIAGAMPRADSGLDATTGTIINGGIAIGVGSSMDGAEDGCAQPSMNLAFSSEVTAKQVLTIEDSDKNVIIRFCPSDAGFLGSNIHPYTAMTVSHPSFELNKTYKIYLDGQAVGYSSKEKQRPGPPGGGQWGGWGSSSSSSSSSSGSLSTDFTFTKTVENFSGMQVAK